MAVAALDQLRSLFSGTTGSIVTPINKNNNNNNKNEFADRYQAAVTPPGRTLAGPLQLATNQTTAAVHQAMEEDPKIALFANFNNGFVAVVMFYGTTQPSHRRPLSRFTTSEAWRELYEQVYKTWLEVCKTLPTGAALHYTIHPIGFAYEWPKDGSDDAAAQKAVDTISKTVQSLAKTKGTLLDFKYMTFDTCSQKVLGSYGAENIKLMQEVAAKYDPEGVFQKLQNGGFLLRDNI
ncbi:hypothetical protein CBS63078_9936 [Aspergillus niger]|nr:hypothetical protein CBS115989_7413 [Aspergillus niger]KAI2835509.1 hypothetical protein CBS11232_10475 [Aspergillus niger]KAI2868857.1 hypothetical protein CBS13152_10503 [Aspergillus niger]KAI2871512.1 hypothetical protein CBS115988_8576 [Aspergillus niger]KAI2890727.1 hypothetical protein CBS63078_9936 [Aspergillus niger]